MLAAYSDNYKTCAKHCVDYALVMKKYPMDFLIVEVCSAAQR